MKNPRMPRPSVVLNHEYDWRRFERELARRERFRLIRLGRIIPAFKTPPQMMVKDESGNWKAEIKVCQP